MGKIIRSAQSYTLALRAVLMIGVILAPLELFAQQQSDAPKLTPQECASGHPLRVLMPVEFERVPNDTPAVICVFRNKISGFPTLNIVVEARYEGSQIPNLAEYKEGIRKGYESVGLTDATLSDAAVGESNGVPFFTSEVTFTNNTTPMSARILVLQLHDRTYTVSAVGKAIPGSLELKRLIEGVSVDGVELNLHRSPPPLLFIFAGIALGIALVIGYRIWAKGGSSPQAIA